MEFAAEKVMRFFGGATGGIISFVLICAAFPAHGGLSHLDIHNRWLPPQQMRRSLFGGGSVSKGFEPAVEQQLTEALKDSGLGENLIRVAVAGPLGTRAALVKVQVGDPHSRLFSVKQLERNAVMTFHTAFSLPAQLNHVDYWAVVPYRDDAGNCLHRPVFSASARRKLFLEITKGSVHPDRVLLGKLGVTRYAPIFTERAVDWRAAKRDMPRSAYTFRRFEDRWSQLLDEASSALSATTSGGDTAPIIFRGKPNGGKVALTIDDGPHPLITPLFLDVLRQKNVKATFFVVGKKAEQFPGLVREIADAGHELANHTYSHPRFSQLPPREIYAQIRVCSRIVGALTGKRTIFMRPPGGDYTGQTLRVCRQLRQVTALWTRNAGDWTERNSSRIVRNATRHLQPGDIMLMHQGDLCSLRALPKLIDRVRSQGLEPVPLVEVAKNGAIERLTAQQAMARRPELHLRKE